MHACPQAVREAVSVPVLANGNIRTLGDVQRCLDFTGCAGVLSAESLLEDPGLFSPARALPGGGFSGRHRAALMLEYLDIAAQHPPPMRMVTGHAFKMLGADSPMRCVQWLHDPSKKLHVLAQI